MRILIMHAALSASLSLGVLPGIALAASAGPPAKNFAASKSILYPSYVAPSSDAPASCFAAARELDSNRDGKLDEEIREKKKVPTTTSAEACIKDGDAPWGLYLKARTFSAQLKFADAAASAEQAQKSAPVRGLMAAPADDLALFRANALSDAGRFDEAIPIYDALIAKKPNNVLLKQLRANRTWPPGSGA